MEQLSGIELPLVVVHKTRSYWFTVTLHQRARGPTGKYNNGDIEAQSFGAQGNNYTTQLDVTITPDVVGKTIMCVYDALTSD